MLAYGKLSKDLMSHGSGSSGTQIGLEFSGVVRAKTTMPKLQCRNPSYCMTEHIALV